MDMATSVQILDEADCISHSTNTVEEMYESNYSPTPAMRTYKGRPGSLALVKQPVFEKEN